MGKALQLVNGVPRMVTVSIPVIYDETLEVVASGAVAGEINLADAESGDSITLPSGKTYTDDELEVWRNGQRLEDVIDYNLVGGAPRTAISMTFDLEVGDSLRFRIDRDA